MAFWENFSNLCYEIGKAKTVVLDECGINKSANTRWSKGEMPSEKTLIKLSEYFGVSVRDLLGGTLAATQSGVVLSPEEASLIAAWRDATIEEKQICAYVLRKHDFRIVPF